MKAGVKIFIFPLLLLLLFSSCKKIKRDNPLDSKNPNNNISRQMNFHRYEVKSDNNGDLVVNRGETVKLKVFLINNGNVTVNKVRANITCGSPYISSLTATPGFTYYGDGNLSDDVIPGQEAYNPSYYNQLAFTVSSSVPEGTTITFSLSISDGDGHTWEDTFGVIVQPNGANIKFSRFDIYSDNNFDFAINKGEAIKLKTYMKNIGSSRANKVKTNFSCSSPYIFGMTNYSNIAVYNNGNSSFDYMDAGTEAWINSPANYLGFNVSSTTPDGTVITFSVTNTDESNNVWNDTFTITVVHTGAQMAFSRFDVYSDNNSNQQVNPGETVRLKLYVKNNGTSQCNGVKVNITCNDPNISALTSATNISYYMNGNSSFDYAQSGVEAWPSSPLNYPGFTVSPSTTPGSSIPFTITITDESSNVWTQNFNVNIQ